MLNLWARLFLLTLSVFQVSRTSCETISIGNDQVLELADFVCPGDGFYPSDEVYCSSLYYTCFGGVAYPNTCPGVSVYDPAQQKCVPVDEASCQDPANTSPSSDSTTSSSGTTKPTTAGTAPPSIDTQCLSPDGFFSIPGQCGKYYTVCVNGTAYQETCDGGTVFDPVTLLCAEYADATCNLDNFGSCPEMNGFFPLTPDACCPSYISCINSVPFLAGCPAPKSVFEPVALACEKVDVAACWSSQKTLHQLKSSQKRSYHRRRRDVVSDGGNMFIKEFCIFRGP